MNLLTIMQWYMCLPWTILLAVPSLQCSTPRHSVAATSSPPFEIRWQKAESRERAKASTFWGGGRERWIELTRLLLLLLAIIGLLSWLQLWTVCQTTCEARTDYRGRNFYWRAHWHPHSTYRDWTLNRLAYLILMSLTDISLTTFKFCLSCFNLSLNFLEQILNGLSLNLFNWKLKFSCFYESKREGRELIDLILVWITCMFMAWLYTTKQWTALMMENMLLLTRP